MEAPIAIPCSECDFVAESGLQEMVDHILELHPHYSKDEALHYAEVWQESAYEEQELENIQRAEEFRRTGHDPFAEWDDGMPGK